MRSSILLRFKSDFIFPLQTIRQKDGRLEALLSLDECVEKRVKNLMIVTSNAIKEKEANGGPSNGNKAQQSSTGNSLS